MARKIEIFRNCITLTYKDTELEEEYFTGKTVKCKTLIIWIFALGLWSCFYIPLHFCLALDKENPEKTIDVQGIVSSILFSFLLLILLIWTVIKRSKISRTVLMMDTFIINLSLYIMFMETYFILLSLHNFKDNIFIAHVLFFVELIMRIIWHMTVEFSFVINFFTMIISIGYDMTGFAKGINMSCMFPLQTVKLFGVFIIYMIERREKKIFYLNTNQLKESKKMKMLINDIHCGIISFSLDDNQLEYNNMIKSKILNDELMTEENQISFLKRFLFLDLEVIHPESREHKLEKLYHLLKDNQTKDNIFDIKCRENPMGCEFETEMQTNRKLTSGICREERNNQRIEKIIEALKQSTTSNQYILLGIKQVLNASFQIFARFVECENKLEFVVNDIAMVSTFEEIQARVKYKALFLAKVCHEFRNPLMNIIEIAENCGSNMLEYDQHCECTSSSYGIKSAFLANFKKIKNIALFMSNLICDFEYISKENYSCDNANTNANSILHEQHENLISLTPVSIPELIDECVDIFQTKIELNCKNILLQKHISPMPTLMTDERKIKQIILNLLSNSFKFSNFGEITVEASLARKDNEEILVICVKDTGMGIPEDKLSSIQEPFMKVDNDHNRYGLGLGLNIVKSLINALGGRLSILSTLGRGTQVSFEIPIERHISGESEGITQKEGIDLEPRGRSFSLKEEETVNKSQGNDIFGRNTEEKDLDFIIDPSQKIDENHLKATIPGRKLSQNEKKKSINSYKDKDIRTFRFLVVDDEKLIRESHKKLLENYFLSLETKTAVEIIECKDGAECLYELYKCTITGKKIDVIFSDESMNFIRGSVLYKIIQILLQDFIISPIKFCLVTSYEVFDIGLDEKFIIKKPLTRNQLSGIMSSLL